MSITVRFWNALQRVWSPHRSSEQGAVRGAVLSLSSRILIKAVYFIKTIILARLLFPEDFGLFGIAAALIGVTDLFQPGFNMALIHEKGDVKKYLNSVWTFNILRYGFFAAIIILLAPLAGDFFGNEAITSLTRAMALIMFIDSFVNVGTVLLQKELQFNKKFLYDISYVIAETIVVIIAALITQSPWALVVGAAGNKIASVVSSFVLHPFRPKFSIDVEHIRHLFVYGKWLWFGAILTFIAGKFDIFAIGKMLEPDALGYFQLAFGLAMLPSVEVARVLGMVLFPYASIVQFEIEKIRKSFVEITRIVMAITIPTIFGFWIYGEPFVRLVYGEKWLPMVGVGSVLIVVGCVRSLEYITNPIALGRGRPDIPTKTLGVQAIFLGSSIIPLINAFGLMGAVYAWLLSILLARLAGLALLFGDIGSLWGAFLKTLILPLVASTGMYLFLVFLTGIVSASNIWGLLLGIVGGALVYSGILMTLDYFFGKRLIHSLVWLRSHS